MAKPATGAQVEKFEKALGAWGVKWDRVNAAVEDGWLHADVFTPQGMVPFHVELDYLDDGDFGGPIGGDVLQEVLAYAVPNEAPQEPETEQAPPDDLPPEPGSPDEPPQSGTGDPGTEELSGENDAEQV